MSPEEDTFHARDSRPPARERSNTRDVANLGLVRPPLIYLAAILVGVGLDLVWPLRWLPAGTAVWVGVPLVILSLALFVAAIRQLKKARTPVRGNKPTTAIVQSGPYRFSRNPIYLAFSLLVLGIACWVNSVWLLGTLILAVLLMSMVVIPREERYLARRFNPEYLQYRAKVRRWL